MAVFDGSQTATIWIPGMASMGSISLSPWVPQPMYARLIFSLGGTNPGPPSTCRGTIANVVAPR
ncbi:MAG: hypothetical protein ABI651_15875, partial [Verrucomicrobiota bacterium]